MGTNWFSEIHTDTHPPNNFGGFLLVGTTWISWNQSDTHPYSLFGEYQLVGTNWISEIHRDTQPPYKFVGYILVSTNWFSWNQSDTQIVFFESINNWWVLTGSLKFIQIPTHRAILVDTYWWVLTGFLGINHTPTHIAFLEGTNCFSEIWRTTTTVLSGMVSDHLVPDASRLSSYHIFIPRVL